ncbi:unnamed protein product, partial [Mesorhabditis spiculigera]
MEAGIRFLPKKRDVAQKKRRANEDEVIGDVKQYLAEFDECVDTKLRDLFSEPVSRIVGHLARPEKEKDEARLSNVFDKAMEIVLYPTAVVVCHLADTASVVEMCRSSLAEHGLTNAIMINPDSEASEVIDQLVDITENCVLIVRQAESLPFDLIDKILKLLRLTDFLVEVAFLICLSTSPMYLASICSKDSLDEIEVEVFKLDITSRFQKKLLKELLYLRNPFEHDLNAIFLSGGLLKEAFDNYMVEHKSVDLLKNALRHAVIHKVCMGAKPLTSLEDTQIKLQRYAAACEAYSKLSEKSLKRVHADVQLQSGGFEARELLEKLRSEKADRFEELLTILEPLRADGFEPEIAELSKLVAEWQRLHLESKSSQSVPAETPKRPENMTFAEFQRQREAKKLVKTESPLVKASEKLRDAFLHLFQEALVPLEKVDGLLVVDSLPTGSVVSSTDPARFIEASLLQSEETVPLALAYKTLMSFDGQKELRLGEWVATFKKEGSCSVDESPSTLIYAAAAHFEYIGVTRPRPEKDYPAVQVAYYE